MTTITLTISHGGTQRDVRINGRLHKTERVAELQHVAPGTWHGTMTNGYAFEVFGGKAAGGSSRDWFVGFNGTKAIECTSARDAFDLIDSL